MRRFIAYISMAIAMILCVGVAVTPVFSKMIPGREFSNGREIVYVLKDKENPESGVLPIESNDKAAKEVAEEIKNRLDNMYIEDYSVKVQGNDTVSVNFSTNDDTEFNYVSKYLGFNGGDFSLSGKNEETRITKDKVFKDVKAYIYRENDLVPYVVFPVSDSEAVKTLIKTVTGGEEEKEPETRINRARRDGEGGDEKQPDIFLWANWVEGDSFEIAEKDPAVTGQKIICQFMSDNIWFQHSKEAETELAYLCGFGDAEGNYDANKLEAANKMANYICNMFNASSYKYDVDFLFSNASASGVTYQSLLTQPAAENLLVLGSKVIDINVSSYTFIASIVAIAICSLLLIMFFRLPAVGVIANTSVSVLLSYIAFFAMKGTFNLSAIIGGVVVALASVFVAVAYLAKFKEEVYKGRTLRKANQEASKKMNLLTIDTAVVTAFAGLMVYLFGGVSLKPLGTLLFFGSIISLLMNLIMFKILMYLLTNTTAFQDKYNLFNIDSKLVPNVLLEEKPTYVAPYEKTNFSKGKKPVGVLALLLTVASVVVISVFGAIDGSPLNTKTATANNTVVYTSIRADKVTLESEDAFKNYVLKNIEVDGEKPSYDDVDGVKMSSREEYDYETSIGTKYHYFVVNFDNEIADNAKISYTIEGVKYDALSIDDAIYALVENVEGAESSGYINVSAKVSEQTVSVLNQGFIALASGLSIVGAALYFAFRYRPSRGAATLLVGGSTTAIAYGLLVASRIGTQAISVIAMPIVALLTTLTLLFIFNKEKDIVKEEKGTIDLVRREEISKRSVGVAASSVLFFLVMAAFVAIDYFGFMRIEQFTWIFADILIGIIIAGVLALVLAEPLACLFEKAFSKIKMPEFKHKNRSDKIKLQAKPKTSEPEERIFIGIND